MLKKKDLSYLAILLIMVTSSLFFYCNSSHNSNRQSGNTYDYNPYFPVGDHILWSYINQAPRDETELFDAEVSGIQKEKEYVVAIFPSFPYFSKINNGCLVRITNDGDVFVKDSLDEEKMLLPGPSRLQQGYSWQYGNWTAAVIATNVTVKTEKKDFENCVYVNYSLGGITFSVELWLAKDAGIVKWGSNRTNPPSRFYTYYVLK